MSAHPPEVAGTHMTGLTARQIIENYLRVPPHQAEAMMLRAVGSASAQEAERSGVKCLGRWSTGGEAFRVRQATVVLDRQGDGTWPVLVREDGMAMAEEVG